MAEVKEVFISYHEKSAGELVRRLADRLEGAGISCWYASRDLPPGEDFAKHIPEQINNCKAFLFILNEGANTSEHMGNEMAVAFRRKDKGLAIIPYQVEKCGLALWLKDYYLARIQVISAERMDAGALATEIAHKLGREPVKNGNCGKNTKWEFQDGVLTISKREYAKEGTMGDFYPQSVPECVNTPWWSDRERIKSVVIENVVTNIGDWAFYGCSGLTSVRFPDSLASIGNRAFRGCSGLTSVRFPDSLASIGDFAFDGCSGLTNVRFPDSLASIGNAAFYGCSGLASVRFPDSLASIGNAAFYGCSGLTSVRFPDSLASIGRLAFDGCSGLTSVRFPDSLASIGRWAFVNCPNLKSVSVPANTKISPFAFDDTTEVIRRPAK